MNNKYYSLEESKNQINELKGEISILESEIEIMQRFFDKLSIPLIKKVIRRVEKQLRRFPLEARQFGDDSKLNSFEEVCVMLMEGSIDDYPFVSSTVESCCEDAYNQLNAEEKFIINHQTSSSEENGIELITNDFFIYATNYESRRINDSYESRC